MYGEVGVISMNNQTSNNQMNNSSLKVQSGGNASKYSSKMRPLPRNVQNNPKYTENWINVKAISNSIIYNDRNEMVTGVKIQPKNIFILDSYSMDNTLTGLMNFYNTIDYEFWILVIDRPVDITMYESELQILFGNTSDPRRRKLISQDLDKADYFKNNNVVDIEYYLLFKEKNMEMLQKKVRNLINGFASCGMSASQASNEDLRVIIDNILNSGKKYESGAVVI